MAAVPDSVRSLLAFTICLAACVLPPVASMSDGRAFWPGVACIVAASGTIYVLRRPGRIRRERRARGQCVRCGYNMTGNVSGVCPECGRPAETFH